MLAINLPATILAAGGLSVLVAGPSQSVQTPDDDLVPRIQERMVEVQFETAQPDAIESVEVWYTYDCGRTWQRFQTDQSRRQSPVMFVAPQEGLCGLFVIVRNRAGASSPPPTSETTPHQWCFIDWTPPLFQLHTAQKEEDFERTRRIALKWTAIDLHLLPRPIAIYYMVQGQRTWTPIELHLINSGRYDWRVPNHVDGTLALKVAVADRGGHLVERFAGPIHVKATVPVSASQPDTRPSGGSVPPKVRANHPLAIADAGEDSPTIPADAARTSVQRPATNDVAVGPKRPTVANRPTTVAAATARSERSTTIADAKPADRMGSIDRTRAEELYRAGTYYRLRGLYGNRSNLDVAAVRFREALRADPKFADARLDLAGVLFLQGKPDEAVRMYETLLEQSPDHRGALKGLALAMVHRGQFDTAKSHLRQLVELDPNDGEAWLNLGDVHHKSGDLDLARDYWTKAAGIRPMNGDVANRARRRLATYTRLPLVRP